MKITNYKDALNYLESFIGRIVFKVDREFLKKHDPLERMRIFLSLLGNPQDKFKSVLIGGTSGKSSTAYLISHILTTAGYKTGFTLSPHLQKINERLQINGLQISDDEFVSLVNSLVGIIEQMKKMKIGAPSYFEILVGMAFTYFAKEKVDIAVVEVGMGGEFDATNTLNPLIAVLTNVSLDHTNFLGKTIKEIARTKAGIIKSDKRQAISDKLAVISAVKQPSVIKIVEDRCKKVGTKLYLLGRDFNYKIKKESFEGSIFDLLCHSERSEESQILRLKPQDDMRGLKLSLLGDYQAENASLAIKTVLELKKFGLKIADTTIRKALKTAFFPGRFEIINYTLDAKRSTLILDGAHNPTKMKEFLKNLKKLFPNERKVFVIGFKFDKDISKMLKEIIKVADEIIVTEFNRATDMNMHASYDALKLKAQISKLKTEVKVIVEKDSGKALVKALAIEQSNNRTIIVITGSLYLVGEIRSML